MRYAQKIVDIEWIELCTTLVLTSQGNEEYSAVRGHTEEIDMRMLYAAAIVLATMSGAAAQVAPLPNEGGLFHVTSHVVLCDTLDQVRAIVNASAESANAGAQKYRELRATTNGRGKATCDIVPRLHATVVEEPVNLGILHMNHDMRFRAHGVHVKNPGGEGWFLHITPLRSQGQAA